LPYDGHCGYKFRLYPNDEQTQQIETTFNACIRVWNLALELKDAAYKNDKTSLSVFDINKMITRWKRILPWLSIAPISALQQTARNLDQAYKNAFKRLKKGEDPGFPKYKTMRTGAKSYKTPAGGRKGPDGKVIVKTQAVRVVDRHHIILPKLGTVRCRGMQDALVNGECGHVLSATVSRTPTGKYYCSVGCEDVPQPEMEDGIVDVMGVRVAVGDGITRSDGIAIPNPKAYKKYERKARREQRRLSRKVKGSHNYEKQRRRKARVDERVADIRSDHIHKVTKDIVRDSKSVIVGRSEVKKMTKAKKGDGRKVQRSINRAILDSAIYTTTWRLEYKADRYGRQVIVLQGGLPWTRTCSRCGAETGPTKPGVAQWTCTECGTTHVTSENAARNIQYEGAAMLKEMS